MTTPQSSPAIKPCGCARPAIATMDYDKVSPANWNRPQRRINRCCTRCWSHWFGALGAVKFFTRKEWNAYVAEGWA